MLGVERPGVGGEPGPHGLKCFVERDMPAEVTAEDLLGIRFSGEACEDLAGEDSFMLAWAFG